MCSNATNITLLMMSDDASGATSRRKIAHPLISIEAQRKGKDRATRDGMWTLTQSNGCPIAVAHAPAVPPAALG